MNHPREALDDLLVHGVRFSIVAAVAQACELDFGFVRDTLDVSDSVLSRQVSQLEEAGYVRVRKGYVGKRPRTWLSCTARGKKAFAKHVAALNAIIGERS